MFKTLYFRVQHLCDDAGVQLHQRPQTALRSTNVVIQLNVFSGITKNPIFLIVVASVFVLQLLLVTFAGKAFGVYENFGLTIQQWLICVLLLLFRSQLAQSPYW